MTYDEFRRQLGKAGVTVKEFATLVRLNPNSVTNYARAGTVPPHFAVMAILMGEMAENHVDFRGALLSADLGTERRRSATPGTFGGNPRSPRL
ncbi:XRE family transcriptional regulator [Burkholderia vietnamiensis]|uniref:XRE family transcriptional regulator n=1 Tax=Burkholderia vietnamiensis TaxID=60552 RepID=UPI001CF319BB|nr:XRE family transcriptional regulator [Burkholderia vietnamiensis]MCA8199188.1 XRE family transcriptional regulator [Burkholderia vietnamiensis]